MSRTLFIGLDGGTFTVFDQLMDAGLMRRSRDWSPAERVPTCCRPPTPDPPAWTSLVTGRSPGQHGIFDFVRVEQHGDYPNFRLATSSDVRCPTIWSRAGDAGRRLIALNFPVAFPPRPINGFLIPGFVPHRHLQRAMFPAGLHARLRGVAGIDIKELAVDFEDERRSVQVLAPERHEDWIQFHVRRERQWYG